jgi:hypothetical protein
MSSVDREFQSLSLTHPTNPLRVDDDGDDGERRGRKRRSECKDNDDEDEDSAGSDIDFVHVRGSANHNPSRFRRRVRSQKADKDSPVGIAQQRRSFSLASDDGDDEEDEDGWVQPVRFSMDLKDAVDKECLVRPAEPGEGHRILQQYLQEREEKNTYVNQEAVERPDSEVPCGIKLHKETQKKIVEELQRLAQDERDKLALGMRDVLSADLCRDTRRGMGDQRLEAIRKCLNEMGYTRSQFQRLFHDKFTQACLPIIYGEEWPICCERVMKELGIDRIRPEVLVQT